MNDRFLHRTLATSILLAVAFLVPAPAEAKIEDLDATLKTTAIDAASGTGASQGFPGGGARVLTRPLTVRTGDGASVTLPAGESVTVQGEYRGYLSVTTASGRTALVNKNFTAPDPNRRAAEGRGGVGPEPSGPAGGASEPAPIGGGTVRVNTDLNVRTGPWGDIIGSLYNGNRIEILGREGDWLRIRWNGRIAFVHSAYVNVDGGVTGPPAAPPSGPPPARPPAPPPAPGASAGGGEAGVVRASGGLNVRTAPWGPIIGGLSTGTAVTIKRRQGEWAVIDYNGTEAFVFAAYVVAPGSAPPADEPSAPPVVAGPGGFTFPVNGPCSFSTRSWAVHGAGGGPFNKGVDIFAHIGVPLVACKSGSIRISVNSLGGNALHVAQGGEDFYYAHLSAFGNVRTGQGVPAGYEVGKVGDTGNARGKSPHVHFGYVRNGSTDIDSTQMLINAKHSRVQVGN